MTLPTARVTALSWRDDRWFVNAQCPEGRSIAHGGGDDPAVVVLGHRGSHCPSRRLKRRELPCSHLDYSLTADPSDYPALDLQENPR